MELVYIRLTTFNGYTIPKLGFGTMRLPTKTNSLEIDYSKSIVLIDKAMELGINYFDLGYIYRNGSAEPFLAKALSGYPRDSYILSDKLMTGFKELDKAKIIIENQLDRLNTNYIDFYLIHGIIDINDIIRFEKIGILNYLCKLKDDNVIRNIGFSFHGKLSDLDFLINRLDYKWDVVQIQLNYLDWFFRNSRKQYDLISNANIPIIAMESFKGGLLIDPPQPIKDKLYEIDKTTPPIEWNYRFFNSLDNVLCILSGMNSIGQIIQNHKYINDGGITKLTDSEFKELEQVSEIYTKNKYNTCTRCNYCLPECLKNINIPEMLDFYYNKICNTDYIISETDRVYYHNIINADSCIRCMKCGLVCTQRIPICNIMEDIKLKME